MADYHLFMECEEEELEPWQQVTRTVQGEEVAVEVTTVPYPLAPAPGVGSPGPEAVLPAPVSMVMEVPCGGLDGESELMAVVPSNTPPSPLTSPSPPAALPSAPSAAPPVVHQLQPGQRLILTQNPASSGPKPVPQVLCPVPAPSSAASPGSVVSQPIFITTQGFVANAAAGQNLLNPVGFLLNGQTFTFLPAPSSQVLKPAIAPALSQLANQQPAIMEASRLPVNIAPNQQQPVTTPASQQPAASPANQQQLVTMATVQQVASKAADQQPEASQQPGDTLATNQQLATTVNIQQPAPETTNQQPLKSFTLNTPAAAATKVSELLAQKAAMSTSSKTVSGVSSFTLQKITDNRPFKSSVTKLIQVVNKVDSSGASQGKILKVVKRKTTPPADSLSAAPPSKVKDQSASDGESTDPAAASDTVEARPPTATHRRKWRAGRWEGERVTTREGERVTARERRIEDLLVLSLLKPPAAPPAPPPPPRSAEELYLLSLVPSLQRLSPQQREYVKFQIQKLIYEVSYGRDTPNAGAGTRDVGTETASETGHTEGEAGAGEQKHTGGGGQQATEFL